MRKPAIIPTEALLNLRGSGEPISSDTFAKASKVLELLKALAAPPPFVFPTEIGGVQLEWHGEQNELDIEISPDSSKLAYVTFESKRPSLEGEIDAEESALRQLLKWIH